jgi:hypothetical protein
MFPPWLVIEKTKHRAGLIALHGANHGMIAGKLSQRYTFPLAKQVQTGYNIPAVRGNPVV